MEPLNVVFICQSVDLDDMLLSNVVRWIDVLGRRTGGGRVNVISLRSGRYELPENVSVHTIGASHKLVTLWNFYRVVLSLLWRRQADLFFVHMGGVSPVLLAPIKLLTRKRLYQWKAHPHINWVMRLSYLIDDKIFTATASSFPVKSPKVMVVGHGIDLGKFTRNRPLSPSKTLVTVSRLSRVKRIDEMIAALAIYRDRYGPPPDLEIIGEPVTAPDRQYLGELQDQIGQLALKETVRFLGKRSQDDVADIVSRSMGFLGFSGTALDKATVEAMALRAPVISTNPCFEEILPPSLVERLVARSGDCDDQAEKIHDLIAMDDEERLEIGETLRSIVNESHTDEALFDKILAEIAR